MTRGPADSLDTVDTIDSAPVDDSMSPAATVDSAPAEDPTSAPAPALDGIDAAAAAAVDVDNAALMEPELVKEAAAHLRKMRALSLALGQDVPQAVLDFLDTHPLRRLRRDPNLPAVRFVEGLFPETSLFKSAIYILGPRELESIVCVNRQFKAECYDARLLTGRGCMALTGQDCDQNAAEARKWYRICADMHGTREAFAMLGAIANEGGASSVIMEMISSLGEAAKDLDESERCLRAAIAADDSHVGSYVLLAPADHALDVARVDLAMTLASKASRDRDAADAAGRQLVLDEMNGLLDEVLGHDEVPSVHEVPFRHPHREAATLKAQMIHKGQAPGTPLDVLALIEAIPPDDRDVNCHYLLGEIYKKLDEELNEDQLARRAFAYLNRAYEEGHPRSPFDLGQLFENGRGTEAHLPSAYFLYVTAAVHAEDDRAVGRLAEVAEAGPPYPPELVAALSEFTQFPEPRVEDAFAALGLASD